MEKKIIDLTHTMNEGMTVYPGSSKPVIERVSTIEKEGYSVLELTTTMHNGTHIDAPFHMVNGGNTLDEYPLDKFIGKAVVIDCSKEEEISLNFLRSYENMITESEFVLFYTGWGKKWNTEAYFESFSVLTEEAALWLSDFKLKAVGFDCFSIDTLTSTDMKLHKIVLSKDTLIIENLNNLEKLPSGLFDFYCIPLKLEKADGSPVRAFGIV